MRVFPTGVGVYRLALPAAAAVTAFSPQAWGCTAGFGFAVV